MYVTNFLMAVYDMFSLRVFTVVCLCISNVVTEELCLMGDFDSQFKLILQSQMMSTQKLASISVLVGDVRNTLKQRWTDVQVSLFGSLLVGLGTKVSDVDLLVQSPNANGSLIEDISKLFQQQTALYSHVTISTAFKDPVLTFYHIPTQIYSDIIDEYTNGLETSNLFKYYINLDRRHRPLGLFLKLWLKFHDITGSSKNLTKFQNYTLYTLIIFYLQQVGMVPSGFTLQSHLKSGKNYSTNDWNVSFNKLPYRSTNIDNMYALLGGFFKYYSEFNFQDFIVSPFAGRPIDKRSFMDVKSIPQEFSLYKTFLTNHFIEPIVVDSEMCIQDIFEHNCNIVDELDGEEASRFIAHVKYAAQMYDTLPSDCFLRAILIPTQDKTTERKDIDTMRQPKNDLYNNCINFTLINE